MRILIDMGHPAHVHFFKNFIWEMEKNGHEIKVTARDKEVTQDLLNKYGFAFQIIGKSKPGKTNLLKEWIIRDFRLYKSARNFKPDILMGIGNPSIAHVSKIIRKSSIIFTDTEHAKFSNSITFPFSDVICTPDCYRDSIGSKQIRYNGYHEIAYLHPHYFTPNPTVLDELGFDRDDNIFLVRFAAFNASHDTNTEHFDKRYVPDLITKLEDKGTVVISSEIKLNHNLQKYQLKISPEKYHDLLYFSKMYIGEGSTSAMEAAILGVPSLHFERLNIDGQKSTILPYIGVLNEIETKYNLLYSYCDERYLLSKVDEILTDLDREKAIWDQRRNVLLKDKIDVTAFMVWLIENYPKSFNQLRNNPKFEESFKTCSSEVI